MGKKLGLESRLKILNSRYPHVYDIIEMRFMKCLDYVCFVMNVDKEVLLSSSRQHPLTDARHVLSYLLVKKERLSITQVALLLSVTHDVVIHSVYQAIDMLEGDAYYGNIIRHYISISEERMELFARRKSESKT